MKKIVLVWSFLLCNLFLIDVANAVVIAKECDNCTYSQLYQIALTKQAGVVHYYYDLTQGSMTAWETTREPGANGTYVIYADEVNVPSDLLDTFNKLKVAVATYGRHTVDSTATVVLQSSTLNISPQITAYMFITTSSVRNNFYDSLGAGGGSNSAFNNALSSVEQTIWGLLQAGSEVVFDHDLISLNMKIVFNDGTKVTIYFTAGNEPKIISAQDVNNNSIALTEADIPGYYVFQSGNGLNEWLNYMQLMGVEVDVNPSTATGTVIVECIKSTAGDKCVHPQ